MQIKPLKLSIIVPIYNVEQYLEKCLLSILQQAPPETVEVIAINDGTPDKSGAIVKKLQQQYSNLILIEINNGGLSAARNRGLANSKGEYVWFIDSDDYIVEDCIPTLLKLLDENSPNILHIGYKEETLNNVTKIVGKNTGNLTTYVDNEFVRKRFLFSPMAMLYISNLKFLMKNNLCFKTDIIHEDEEFTPRLLYYANKVCYFDKIIYCYVKRENSITSNPENFMYSIDCCCNISILLNQFICENKILGINKTIIHKRINLIIYQVIKRCSDKKEYKLLEEKLNLLRVNNLYPIHYNLSFGIKYYFKHYLALKHHEYKFNIIKNQF